MRENGLYGLDIFVGLIFYVPELIGIGLKQIENDSRNGCYLPDFRNRIGDQKIFVGNKHQ